MDFIEVSSLVKRKTGATGDPRRLCPRRGMCRASITSFESASLLRLWRDEGQADGCTCGGAGCGAPSPVSTQYFVGPPVSESYLYSCGWA
eukprot:6764362-Prymnesium_polylepis.1